MQSRSHCRMNLFSRPCFSRSNFYCTFDLNLIKEQYSIEILSVAPVVIGLTPLADPYGHEIKQLVVRLAEDQKSIGGAGVAPK